MRTSLPNFSVGALPTWMEGKNDDRQETMMLEENLARLRAHRNNMQRYRRLLATQLSDLERTYIARRLEEEQAACETLLQMTFPVTLPAARQALEAATQGACHVQA